MSDSRTTLITGGTSGIGKAIANRIGGSVLTLARKNADILCDLSNLEAVNSLPLPETIDTLICNAGYGLFGNLEQLSLPDIQHLFTVNTLSHIALVKRLLPQLKQKERSDIIFIGSEAALQGKRQGSIYCASKFALRGFAQALRDECASSPVNVSIVHPGMVRTPFFNGLYFEPGQEPTQAIEPEDIAETIRLILSMRPGTILDEIILSPKTRVFSKKKLDVQ